MEDELGWKHQGNDWYQRSVTVGTMRILVDIWALDANDWALSYNAGKAEHIIQPTAAKAMLAADTIVAGHLRAAARSLARSVKERGG